jgi:type IV secretory pathway VirB10-like protein
VPIIPAGVSWPARDFITGALHRCPLKRTEVHAMLGHAWVDGFSTSRSVPAAPVRQAVAAVNAISSGVAALPTTRSQTKAAVKAPLMHAPPTPVKAVAVAPPAAPPQRVRAATPVPGSAADRLLAGSASLQEYLQGQARRATEAKRTAAAANGSTNKKPAFDMRMLAAAGDGSIVVSTTASPVRKGTHSLLMTPAQSLNVRGL